MESQTNAADASVDRIVHTPELIESTQLLLALCERYLGPLLAGKEMTQARSAIEKAQQFELKRKRDLDSIRFAMQQALDTFDAFATLADKTDEATLNGMRSMLSAFDAEVRMCDSR